MRVRILFALLVALAGSARAEPFELSVLTYNTHGLPSWLAEDEPEKRTPLISKRLGAYDLVLLQEDWAYHDELVADAGPRVVLRGNGARWLYWPSFGGSGLTALVKAPRDRVTQVVRESYDECAGWFSGRNDCLVAKGFLRFRLGLPDGRSLDVYQTHLESGSSPEDVRVRQTQLDHLARRVETLSAGQPVVLAGDFNLNWAREGSRAALEAFVARLGLRDTGAAGGRRWRWKRIDYIFVRSSPSLQIEVVEAGEDTDFAHDGRALSDHPALFTRLRLR